MCNFIKDDNTTYMYYETKTICDYSHGYVISTHKIISYSHSTILFYQHVPVLLGCVVLVATVMVWLNHIPSNDLHSSAPPRFNMCHIP